MNRSKFKQRLVELEARYRTTQLRFPRGMLVDYVGLADYDDGTWIEITHDDVFTVVQNRLSKEVRAYYADRRKHPREHWPYL